MFKVILKELMKEHNLNQRQLSIKTNIPPTTINGWFVLDRLPDYNSIKTLAEFFNVSSDYLLELTKDPYKYN